ncbi:MAG: TonB-dependent receptor, partial [Saprospiraceae bacterium]|nr:TonB-dependent receptor [Saprospiraceae bacterium]
MLIFKRSIFLFLFMIVSSGLFAQSGVIEGSTVNKFNNEPLPFVTLLVIGTDNGVVSDIDGNYKIEGLSPGLYDIRASFVGFDELTVFEIQVTNSKPTVVNFELVERSTSLDEVVVTASPFVKTEESPVSLRSIGVAEIQRNPGGNRDISKVVQSLPGVTSTANFRNDLIIRGGSPNENRFYLDDVEVPNINHFATQGASGGPVGLINVNFIREVDFYSGAFPANRGNTLSSVFNFKQKDGRSDKLGLSFTAGASDVGLTLEGPIGEKTTFLFSARRSYLQFLFAALELPFLPTYNDFQVKVKTKINQRNEIYFVGLGAIDEFRLNLDANETEDQQYLLNNLPVSPQWNYTNGLVYKHYRDNGYWTAVLSRNMLNNESKKYINNDDTDDSNLILDYASQESENKFRLENTTRVAGWKINTGFGYEGVRYTNNSFLKIATPLGPEDVFYDSKVYFNKYSVFTQLSKKLLNDKLAVSVGARMDGNNYSTNMSNMLEQFSPRLS